MPLASHPYKTRSQSFDGSSNTSGTTTSGATPEFRNKITVKI